MSTSEKIFLVLSEELSFSRAAQKCYLSQQGVSDHIKHLEKRYGVQLFTRRPTVELTESGQVVLETLQRIQLLEKDLNSQLSEIENGTTGSLRIGMNYTRARLLSTAFFEQYQIMYPNVKIEFTLEETATMLELLKKGQLDFFLGVNAVCEEPIKSTLLHRETIYLIASKGFLKNYFGEDDFDSENKVDLQKFHGLPFVMNYSRSTTTALLEQHMTSLGISLKNIITVSDYDISANICRTGLAASFCPQMILPALLKENNNCSEEHQLCALQIKDLNQPMRFELVYNGMLHYPRYVKDCMTLLQKITQDYTQQKN